jgi:hypothetical protein
MYCCTVSGSFVRNGLGLGVHADLSMCGETEETDRGAERLETWDCRLPRCRTRSLREELQPRYELAIDSLARRHGD